MREIILFDDIFNTGIQKLSSLINPNPLVGCQAIGFDAVTLRYGIVVACYGNYRHTASRTIFEITDKTTQYKNGYPCAAAIEPASVMINGDEAGAISSSKKTRQKQIILAELALQTSQKILKSFL